MPREAIPKSLTTPREGVTKGMPEWDQWIAEIEEFTGYKICGHKKKNNVPCVSPPVQGRTRCKFAGGMTPRGPESNNWRGGVSKRGYYQQMVPQRLQETYAALMDDPRLLSLRSDIALLDIRQMQLFQRMHEGVDPVATLQKVRTLIPDVKRAMAEGNEGDLARILSEIEELATTGVKGEQLWEEFVRVGEQKRKHTDTEGKHLERSGKYMTAEEVRTYNQMVLATFVRASEDELPPDLHRRLVGRVLLEIAALAGIEQSTRPQEAVARGERFLNP